MRPVARLAFVYLWSVTVPAFAGFASTETFLPAVGRVAGQGGAQFYTTVWATNLTGATVNFTFDFLKQGQANTTPASFADTLSPGQTKVYENVIQSKLGLASAIGAARITSSGEILLAERIFNQALGADLGNTEGLFFAGVPKSFSISAGQSASIQGINQGGSENFRYNFALVETGGGSPTVNVQIFDGAGALLGQKAYTLQPYEQLQPNVAEIVAGIHTTNARITATVTGGTGSVLLAGAQLANISQDSSGFEMSFRDELLGSGGVTSLNGLTGALTLNPGSGISITPSGSSIAIAYTGGGGSGLTSVTHDGSLSGAGTGSSPLAIANGQIVRSLTIGASTLHDAVTFTAGSNVTLTPSGSTLTIASTGGGLTLPYSGSSSSGSTTFVITNSGTGGDAIQAFDSDSLHSAVAGFHSAGGTGVYASSNSGYGVKGISSSGIGVYGQTSSSDDGVQGVSSSGDGVHGISNSNGDGVLGEGNVGVRGVSAGHGVVGVATYGTGVQGGSDTGYAVEGIGASNSNNGGVFFGGITVASGSKSFVEPHPTDPTKEIRFVCLEGPESGTYFRGTGRIVNGFATIDVPESFRMVSRQAGLTVQLTPVGAMASLAAISRSLDRIIVQGSRDVDFDYMVNGIRRSVPSLDPVEENRYFVPRSPHDPALTRPLGEEVRARLVRSGILNPDGTINLETAHRLGWDQQESWKRAEAAATR